MESTIKLFVRKSLDVNNTILQIFEEKLGLPPGALMERHKLEEFSGSKTRVIKTPPSPLEKGQLIGSHTDFGSLVCTFS
jgi:isopenicillin N synthase-like dioxygenase